MNNQHKKHHKNIILFDGVCRLCTGWVRFVINRDPDAKMKFASVQSEAGQQLLTAYGIPTHTFNTMVYIEKGKAYTKSTAFLKIVVHLPYLWPTLQIAYAIPRGLRDWCYDRIAKNRYRIFGKHTSCVTPSDDVMQRFL